MTRHQALFFRRMLLLYDLVVSVVAYLAALSLREWIGQMQVEGRLPAWIAQEFAFEELYLKDYYPLLWGLLPLWAVAFYLGGTSEFRLTYVQMGGRFVRAVGIGIAFFLGFSFVFKAEFLSRSFVVMLGVMHFVSLVLARIVVLETVSAARRQHVDGHRVLVVGCGEQAAAFAATIRTQPPWNNHLIGHLEVSTESRAAGVRQVIGRLEDLDKILDSQPIDEVVFAVPERSPDMFEEALRHCDERGVDVLMTMPPDVPRHGNIEVAQVTGYDLPMLGMRRTPTSQGRLFVKRFLDLSGCLFGLLLTAPILIATAIAIKIDSKGPVLFRQTRAGRQGRKFTMYKFRSMVVDAEARKKDLMHLNEMGGPVFKIKSDPRITAVGRFIRKTSIDELPQLFNVLYGNMSLVGPRPPLPSEVDEYEPWQRRRLSVKPGITGLWQVSGRNQIDFDEWMALDLEYIDNWSLWLDIKILLKTVPVVLLHKGAS